MESRACAIGITDRHRHGRANHQSTGVTRSDRRHILVINYSYAIPNPTPNIPILKHVLEGWEAAGVTQFMSGNPLDPVCGTNLGGVANIDPSLSGIFIAGVGQHHDARCELTGEPIFSGFTRDPNLRGRRSDALQSQRVPPAPAERLGRELRQCAGWRAAASGMVELGLHAGAALRLGGRANLRVQLQVYNLFNQVEFIALNANYLFSATGNTSPDTGKYTTTTNPRNVGITLRLDF